MSACLRRLTTWYVYRVEDHDVMADDDHDNLTEQEKRYAQEDAQHYLQGTKAKQRHSQKTDKKDKKDKKEKQDVKAKDELVHGWPSANSARSGSDSETVTPREGTRMELSGSKGYEESTSSVRKIPDPPQRLPPIFDESASDGSDGSDSSDGSGGSDASDASEASDTYGYGHPSSPTNNVPEPAEGVYYIDPTDGDVDTDIYTYPASPVRKTTKPVVSNSPLRYCETESADSADVYTYPESLDSGFDGSEGVVINVNQTGDSDTLTGMLTAVSLSQLPMWPILGPIGKGNPIVGAEGKEFSDNGRDSLVIKTLNDDYRRRPVDDEELSFDDVSNLNEMFDNMIKSLDDGSIYEGGIKGDGGESAVAQDENDAVKLAAVVNELNALRAQFFSVTKEVEVVNDRIRGLEGTVKEKDEKLATIQLQNELYDAEIQHLSSKKIPTMPVVDEHAELNGDREERYNSGAAAVSPGTISPQRSVKPTLVYVDHAKEDISLSSSGGNSPGDQAKDERSKMNTAVLSNSSSPERRKMNTSILSNSSSPSTRGEYVRAKAMEICIRRDPNLFPPNNYDEVGALASDLKDLEFPPLAGNTAEANVPNYIVSDGLASAFIGAEKSLDDMARAMPKSSPGTVKTTDIESEQTASFLEGIDSTSFVSETIKDMSEAETSPSDILLRGWR